MAIKALIMLGMMAVGSIALTHGPHRLKAELRKVQIQILREVARTDNWGNPDIFQHQAPKKQTRGRHE